MSTKTLQLKDLSPKEKAALLKQLNAEQRNEKKARQKHYDAYKANVSKTVDDLFKPLQDCSIAIQKVKQLVYDKTQELLKKKAELYETSVNNHTHTLTNEDGTISITIGYRVVDGWDDTVNDGILKVKKFISKINKGISENEHVEFLRQTVEQLLSKDAQGNLKASRVLELKKVAEKINNKELQNAIEIIESAFKPKRTKNFVSVTYKDKEGKERSLPLSITDAEINLN